MRAAAEALGFSPRVESVAVRPGKPTFFGRLDDGRRLLGLPGNPASAFVCAELFLKPMIAAWQGAGAQPVLMGARLAHPLPANGPREHWMRGRIVLTCATYPIVHRSSLWRQFIRAKRISQSFCRAIWPRVLFSIKNQKAPAPDLVWQQ